MKKFQLFTFIGLVLVGQSFGAQSLAFSKGSVHFGVGFNWYHNAHHAFEYYYNNNVYYADNVHIDAPAVIFAVDGGIHDMFSLGGDITTFFDEHTRIDTWYGNEYDFVWGITPMFRFGFHPFGIPSIKGDVPVAKSLDPYVGMRMGTSIAILNSDGDYFAGSYDETAVDADFLVTPTIGVRYYFDGGNFGLWAETDFYNFVGAVTFKF